jgi:hypothetical protein
MNSRLIAHVRRKEGGSWDAPNDLADHLVEVAEPAAGFAGAFGSSEAAYAMGLAHDAGFLRFWCTIDIDKQFLF